MGLQEGHLDGWYQVLHYHVVPPLFIVVFTGAVQYLALVGHGDTDITITLAASKALGNAFAWGVVAVFVSWAILWLKLPSRQVEGPPTLFGYKPQYQGNGVMYYWVSLVAFFTVQAVYPSLCTSLWDNMPELLGALNITALLLCGWLLYKGKRRPEHPGDRMPPYPLPYEFYRGMELHPHILGVDVKQLTNCRLGMMGWQLLIIAFYVAGVERHGFNAATLVNLLLQSVYVAKFFWWEAGYFNTLDIILDRAGYYICWGCLVWVPCFYTYSSYYLVAHPPVMGTVPALLTGLLGLAAILLNYRVDYEKQLFRRAPNGQCSLWGRPARFLVAPYRDASGNTRQAKLLASGCWGVARHLNYTFEMLAALAWCMPGFGLGLWPFLYFFFLVTLLVHRTFRDEAKCAQKYGENWQVYCQQVRYRLIPYIF
ncbi:uncharacterized protein [Anabrus simplex]